MGVGVRGGDGGERERGREKEHPRPDLIKPSLSLSLSRPAN